MDEEELLNFSETSEDKQHPAAVSLAMMNRALFQGTFTLRNLRPSDIPTEEESEFTLFLEVLTDAITSNLPNDTQAHIIKIGDVSINYDDDNTLVR